MNTTRLESLNTERRAEESIKIVGVGTTRERALADADLQADVWFGDEPRCSVSYEARAIDRTLNGRVLVWAVEVDYFRESSGSQTGNEELL